MIKVGLVGLGFIGRVHLTRFLASEKAELVAVADRDVERLTSAAAEGSAHPALAPLEIPEGVAVFDSLDDMLAGADVDMVDICLPTFLHAQATVKAAQAGKHVLCEKPMALDLAQSQAMIDAARANGVQLMIAQCTRFWPGYTVLKEVYDSGRLGRLQSLTMRRMAAPPTWSWEAWLLSAKRSGGVIVDLHIHDVDYINFLLGPPRAVFAQGIEHGVTGGIDVVIGNLLYPDMKVTAEAGWIMIYEEGKEPCAPPLDGPDGYTAEIEFFLDCLVEGRDVASVFSPESPQTSLKIVLLERESIARGDIVPFA
jgi:predicted dehydrogenase